MLKIESSALKFRKYITDIALEQTGDLSYHKKLISTVSNKDLRSSIKSISSTYDYERFPSRKRNLSRIDDIINKFKMCKDKVIKRKITKLLIENQNASNKNINAVLIYAESLLDCVNSANELYCPLYNPVFPFGNITEHDNVLNRLARFIQKKLLKFNIALDKNQSANKIFANLYKTYSIPRQAAFALKYWYNSPETSIEDDEFKRTSKFSPIQDFITLFSPDKELSQYVYNKYYLPEVSKMLKDCSFKNTKDIITKIQNIFKKYGTYLFFYKKNKQINEAIDNLDIEFFTWKTASNNTAFFPRILACGLYTFYKFINYYAVGISFSKTINIINTDAILKGNTNNTVRHELYHLNDTDNHTRQKKKPHITRKIIQEMKNAKLSDFDINYAKTNDAEFDAVIAQGYMDGYSENFKNEMVTKRKFKKYVTSFPLRDDLKIDILRKISDNPYWQEFIDTLIKIKGKSNIPASLIHADTKYIIQEVQKLKAKNQDISLIVHFIPEL